jgi:hypothetical protein
MVNQDGSCSSHDKDALLGPMQLLPFLWPGPERPAVQATGGSKTTTLDGGRRAVHLRRKLVDEGLRG